MTERVPERTVTERRAELKARYGNFGEDHSRAACDERDVFRVKEFEVKDQGGTVPTAPLEFFLRGIFCLFEKKY